MISEKSLFFGGSRAQFHKCNVMDSKSLVLYGHPTPSDIQFMYDSRGSWTTSTTISSTRSDAESAPPELDHLFEKICDEYSRCVRREGITPRMEHA